MDPPQHPVEDRVVAVTHCLFCALRATTLRHPDTRGACLGTMRVGPTSSGDLVLPVADDEAFWIGLSGATRAAMAKARLRDAGPYIPHVAVPAGGPHRRPAAIKE